MVVLACRYSSPWYLYRVTICMHMVPSRLLLGAAPNDLAQDLQPRFTYIKSSTYRRGDNLFLLLQQYEFWNTYFQIDVFLPDRVTAVTNNFWLSFFFRFFFSAGISFLK